jgi:hypothetical protein
VSVRRWRAGAGEKLEAVAISRIGLWLGLIVNNGVLSFVRKLLTKHGFMTSRHRCLDFRPVQA